jgi:hypothetical protein
MNAVEFSGKIKKGKIIVPKEYQSYDNELVRIILLFDNVEKINQNKENLKKVFNKMKTEKMFSVIDNPVLWQKNIRDEWE